MEPNNIETNFRQKLNEREIQPSAKAWDRLDAMLAVADSNQNEQPNQKPKRNYNWMYVAASILGFMLIATVFLTQDQEMIDVARPSVVFETQKESNIDENISKPVTVGINNNGFVSTKVEKNAQLSGRNPVKIITPFTEKDSNVSATHSEATAVAVIPSQEKVKSSNGEAKTTNRYVNVDDLLASVESTSKTEKLFKKDSKIQVDSNNLLSEVDGELELSFREKVIQSVSKNYQEVKVALGNRNLKD